MSRIAILTPAEGTTEHYGRWPEVMARNSEPLRRAGLAIEPRSWSTAEDLTDFDLVLPLLAWGYPDAYRCWLDRVDIWEAEGVRIHNQASVLRWNSRKTYLGRLAERGAPVVPTIFVESVTLGDMEAAARRFGTDQLVVKPQVSAGAWRTIRKVPQPGDFRVQPEYDGIITPHSPDAAELDAAASVLAAIDEKLL